MVTKNYCDYCEIEITTKNHPLRIEVHGHDEIDICDTCGEKVGKTLQEIKDSK